MTGSIQNGVHSSRSDDNTAGRRFIRVDSSYSQDPKTTSQLTALQGKGLINYDLLWCLFQAHAEVYTDANRLHEPQILRCKSCVYQVDERTGDKWLAVQSECLNHDSQGFGWSEQLLKIPYFKGTAQITSLLAYPLAHHPKKNDLRAKLHGRGVTFVRLLAQPTCLAYGAMALISLRVGRGSEWEEDPTYIPGRVMVDPDRFSISCSSSSDWLRTPSCPPSKTFSPANTPNTDLMFCHYRILGFSFEQKCWAALAVSKLRDPGWDDKALDRVMMPPVKRELLRSLVSAYRAEDKGRRGSDFTAKGDGQGLIGLLSGAPGVGKTITAQAAAEVSRRPLYAISAGELGTDVSEIDRQLGKVLAAASTWKCVLLIEGCDVFLRRVSLVTNALVSIFLRRLECFQGIAILTTNGIDGMDRALLSRLHFKIDYDNLGCDQRLALWKSSLGPVKSLDQRKLEKIARDYAVNGHEIKNAVACTNTLARSRGTTLTADLLEEILVELSPRCSNVKDTQNLPAAIDEISKMLLYSQAAREAARAPGATQEVVVAGNRDPKHLANGKEKTVARISNGNGKVQETKEMSLKASDLRDDDYSFRNTNCHGNVKRIGAGGSTQWLDDLMRGVMGDSLSLGANQVNKINQALVAVEPSGAASKLAAGITLIYAGSGDLNIQLGNGDMFNVYDGGIVNKAEQMSIEGLPVSTR